MAIIVQRLKLIEGNDGSRKKCSFAILSTSSLDINARTFDVEARRLINLETRGNRRAKARKASRRIEVPHESESRSRSEIAAGGCTCSVCSVCGPPIHHVARSSRRNGLMWSMAEPGNDPLNWSDTAVGQLQAICIAKFRGTLLCHIVDNIKRKRKWQRKISIKFRSQQVDLTLERLAGSPSHYEIDKIDYFG